MGKKNKPTVKSTDLSKIEKLTFSFEFYDKTSTEFCLSTWTQSDIERALHRLQDISTKTFNEMLQSRKIYHFSEVSWEKTTKTDGFPDNGVKDLPAFHFALLGINNQKARVFGAYSTGVFYIVWFDLDHRIWPSILKNT